MIVDAEQSGGISLFNKPNLRFGNRWWKLPKGAQIPSGMRVSRDKGMNPVTGQIHYTIRPLHDMPLSSFIQKLKDFSAVAMPDFPVAQRKV
ncbi:Tse2 family ADP-ribosyltransferase toxin [Rheinheimera sp.]|uniref:Tse2 family ADP-ribosyltransferase toxin n=1 Tax=Rheinheimera sp. TaxID=1869214 RepID=UPI004048A531